MDVPGCLRLLLPVCCLCYGQVSVRNHEKVVEDYVLSAGFDTRTDFPQLNRDSHARLPGSMAKRTWNQDGVFAARRASSGYAIREDLDDTFRPTDPPGPIDRDLQVHHHHVVPPPLPPPAPPLPVPPLTAPAVADASLSLAYGPAFFAIGFIAFLMLLNALQTTLLLVLKLKGSSLLGSLTGTLGSLGRKRRSLATERLARGQLTGFG